MACIYGIEGPCGECRMCGKEKAGKGTIEKKGKDGMENLAALQGILCSEIVEQDRIWGLSYECYTAKVEVKRKSGVSDYIPLVIPKDIIIEGIEKNTPVLCWGKVQTLLERETGKLGVFVFVEHMEALRGELWEYENNVHIIGTMSRDRVYRETPKGKRITDFRIGVPGAIKENDWPWCLIPSLCWNAVAEIVKKVKTGQAIQVQARFQSRKYKKRLENGTVEIRTAYELSVNRIESFK